MRRFGIAVGLVLLMSSTMTLGSSGTADAVGDVGRPRSHQMATSSEPPSASASDAVPEDTDPILLRAETINTSRQPTLDKPKIQSGLRVMGLDSRDPAYYLVQFQGPVREEWKTAVRKAGGTLFGFIPNHAFIVRMNVTTAERIAALPEIAWVGLYQPFYKVAPRLAATAQDASKPIVVTIMTFEPSDVEDVITAIGELGGQAVDWNSTPRWGVIRAEIDPATVDEIARVVQVSWIERFVAPEITNDVARSAEAMNVDAVHQVHGLTGAGQIIGHADTGLDAGNTSSIHPDFGGRIKAAFAWGRLTLADFDSPGSGPMGLSWDGTHLWNIDWATGKLYQLTLAGQLVSSCEPSVAGRAAGLTWDGSAFWYVERDDDKIYQLDTACNVLDSVATPEDNPMGVAWDGTHLWVSDRIEDRIYQIDTSGTVVQSFPSPGPYPSSLLWMDGYLWCGDSTDDMIYKLDASGTVLEWLSSPGRYTSGLAWDGSNVWVSDPGFDRIFKMDLEPTEQGDWSDPDGHGTHTAGSILGDGSASGGDYKGTAPDAELVHQSVMDASGSLGGLPVGLGDLFSQAYDEGARIHSDSWGASVDGEYTTDSAAADAFVWDHRDMLLVFSAGNSGVDANSDGVVDADSTSAPGTAKNVLTVGASENYRPTIESTWASSRFRANPIRDDKRADELSGLAAFSSRGPTDDGRIKPDVVAPGTFVISTRSQGWPFYDDMEGTTTAQSEAENAGPDAQVAGVLHCTSLDARDVSVPNDVELDLPMIACTERQDGETDPHDAQLVESTQATSGDWTSTGDWTITTEDSHSPTHAWANHYGTNAYDRLRIGRTDVRTGGDVIGFWTRYDFESGDRGALFFTDDGTHWIGGAIEGTESEWTHKMYQIPWGYCWYVSGGLECLTDRSTFQFMFLLDADSDATTGYWYIDDTRVFNPGWGLLSNEDMTEPGSTEDEHYLFSGGTSMSAPLTSGAAALSRQFYIDHDGIDPSAALIKATLINGATDITPGQYGVGSTGSAAFSDTMESGASDWSADTPWALTASKSHSPDHSWTDSPSGDYDNNADISLTSVGSFDLTTIPDPGLVFWHQYDIERWFDYGYVEVSTDNGETWTQELDVTGLNENWTRSVVDLSAYASETTVKIRFRLETDSTVTKDGWYIDDVSIEPVSYQEVVNRPDTSQGWGRVNLERSLFPANPRSMVYYDEGDGLSTGETRTIPINVVDSSEPLRITLVWTDYPSAVPAAINLVNNLDLRLTGPDSTVTYPNGLDTADMLNNVEDVGLTNPSLGAYTIDISGTEVPEGPQAYALVISGGIGKSWSYNIYLPVTLRGH